MCMQDSLNVSQYVKCLFLAVYKNNLQAVIPDQGMLLSADIYIYI